MELMNRTNINILGEFNLTSYFNISKIIRNTTFNKCNISIDANGYDFNLAEKILYDIENIFDEVYIYLINASGVIPIFLTMNNIKEVTVYECSKLILQSMTIPKDQIAYTVLNYNTIFNLLKDIRYYNKQYIDYISKSSNYSADKLYKKLVKNNETIILKNKEIVEVGLADRYNEYF